ncbi:ImuA family protein [Nitratireductor mangrovi]|uniref:ImuA family protein n=1 Tax=Nitratireductor mangrovi TaxID=2599600 RepID=UPI001FEDEA93|nr:hypothetical protein [Nitratireductor mangrovi]
MATSAAAREVVFALRSEIARIEGVLPERLAAPEDGLVLRHGPAARRAATSMPAFVRTGVPGFDAALGEGLPRASLTEFHGTETRNAGAVAGFVLCLAGLLRNAGPAAGSGAVCWIGTEDIFREAGLPYLPGLRRPFGFAPDGLMVCAPNDPRDALWIAEEATRQQAFAAIILEMRGHPARLDLTATRRLHRRAQAASRPVFLIREAAGAAPTAAPVRLAVSPAPAALRSTLAGPLAGSIGHAAFAVTVTKSRTAHAGRFILEWSPDDIRFREIRPEDTGALVPTSGHRQDHPAKTGTVMALRPADPAHAASGQPSRKQHPAHRSA